MHDRVGIERLSATELAPPRLIEHAADLGVGHVTVSIREFTDDLALRRETAAALSDRGVTVSLADGVAIRPETDVSDYARDLDALLDLDVTRFNTCSFEPDLGRCFDQIAIVAGMGKERGMEATVEFAPILAIGNLATALDSVVHVGSPNCKVLIDTMHFVRSGSSVGDLEELDPALIGYAQICDAPLVPTNPDYWDEAVFDRMIPGTGELPLAEIIAALPGDIVLGLEVPLRSLAQAGVSPAERLRRTVTGLRELLVETGGRTAPRGR